MKEPFAIKTKEERVYIIVSHMAPEVIEKINSTGSWTPKRVAEWIIDAQDNNLIDTAINHQTVRYVTDELPFVIFMKADSGIVDIEFKR
ncbi:hypothetical protein H8S90_14665 [Olivibacter sp. SDN3]|uniref:hypothetical protein n=1 Tax=Olivibacter sp. SDN3 TaxID=2764720 RepID=UPI00165147E9|nr:hypothetical protein [Olivibacter sp. SDN3]QNL48048.1 hypothetical protein H8S90_14665 [Olivibacter sp. SDN3]